MGSSDSRRGTDLLCPLEADTLRYDGSLMFREIPSLRAVAPAPVGWLHDVDRMTKPCQPSPGSPRVGSHDWRLEAFSAFTPVTARRFAACLSQVVVLVSFDGSVTLPAVTIATEADRQFLG
jgi:hypothetical protein